MPARARPYRRFIASTRAVAAVEFAIILPVLMVMFLGTFDAGRAITIYLKVRTATYTLAAVTNQYTTIQSSDMQAILGATSVILTPYSSSPVVVTVSQIKISNNGSATVNWSASLNGTARSQGSSVSVPTALASPNSYLIFAEVSYTYTPMFGYFTKAPITLSDNLYVTPRTSLCVLYPPQNITASPC